MVFAHQGENKHNKITKLQNHLVRSQKNKYLDHIFVLPPKWKLIYYWFNVYSNIITYPYKSAN